VITSTDESYLGKDFSTDPDFQQGKQAAHLGTPKRQGDHLQSLLAAPAKTNAGKFLGVVIVLLDVHHMVELLHDTTRGRKRNRARLPRRPDIPLNLLLDCPHRVVLPSLGRVARRAVAGLSRAVKGHRVSGDYESRFTV
jgi:hypothetical protein